VPLKIATGRPLEYPLTEVCSVSEKSREGRHRGGKNDPRWPKWVPGMEGINPNA